jgi:DNA-binding NtrC family response regulator
MSLRVLLVEDEPLVALLLEDMLTDLGYRVIGPATSIEVLLAILATEPVDLALIDMARDAEHSMPTADALADKGISFAFVAGRGPKVPDGTRHAGTPLLLKPFSLATLSSLIVKLVDKTAALKGERHQTVG